MATLTSELGNKRIEPSNLINNFKVIDEATIYRSNVYYVSYGVQYTVENRAWNGDLILIMCEKISATKLAKVKANVKHQNQDHRWNGNHTWVSLLQHEDASEYTI